MLDQIKEFLKTKKGKAAIVVAISAGVLYFFPDSAETVAHVADFLADVLTNVADKVQPETAVGG